MANAACATQCWAQSLGLKVRLTITAQPNVLAKGTMAKEQAGADAGQANTKKEQAEACAVPCWHWCCAEACARHVTARAVVCAQVAVPQFMVKSAV